MANYTARLGSQYQLVLTVATQSQSMSNNTSTLSYSLRVDKLSGYGYWTSTGQPYSIKINGQTVKSGTWTYDFNNYSSKSITSGTITVKHNSNGSINVPVAANVSMYSIGTGSVSSSYTPSRILRSIESFIFNFGWGTVDGTKNITFTKPNSNIRASLEWRYYNNKSDTWSNTHVISSDYTSRSNFSFSSDDINLMHTQNPESKEVTIQVLLKSYNGTLLTHTVSRNTTLKLKEEPPIINSTFEVRGQNQTLLGASNLAVQNIHWLKILDNVTANNGASISRISVEFEGRTITSSNAEFKITKSGDLGVYVIAVDSRGLKSVKKIGTVKSTKYLPPSLTSYKAIRLENGVQNPLGTTGAVIGNIKTTTVNNSSGTNINSAWWKVDFQGTTYQDSTINATKSLPIEKSQNFTLEFGDKFKSLKISGTIPRGEAPLVLGKNSVGIGIIPPKGGEGLYLNKSMINGIAIPKFEEFTSQCTTISGVSGLRAYKYGRIAMIRFNYKPTQTGFIQKVITPPSGYTPIIGTAGTVATFNSTTNDLTLGVGLYGDTTDGFRISVASVPSNALIFTIVYMTLS